MGGIASCCVSRPPLDRSTMVKTKYVYTAFGILAWTNDASGDFVKYGSPGIGTSVTQEDLERHTKTGLDVDKLQAYGFLAVAGSGFENDVSMAETNLQEWVDSNAEAPLEPLWPSIDPHHHFQSETFPAGNPMPPPFVHSFGSRCGVMTYDQFAKDVAGNNIVGTVFVEAGYMKDQATLFTSVAIPQLGETRAVQAIADRCPAKMGIVCHVDLSLGGDVVKEHIAKHREVGKNLVGIRHSLAWHKNAPIFSRMLEGQPENVSKLPAFREGMKVLADEGLSYDCWLFHTNLQELIELANACPDNRIICDHVGGPVGNAKAGFSLQTTMAEWKPLVTELAKCKNVFMKLGGLGMPVVGFGFEFRDKPPSSAELAEAYDPWISHCLKCFGPNRCFFESNFHPDKSSGSFTTFWNAFKILAKKLVPGDEKAQRALFYDNAVFVYKLSEEPFNLPSSSFMAETQSLPAY